MKRLSWLAYIIVVALTSVRDSQVEHGVAFLTLFLSVAIAFSLILVFFFLPRQNTPLTFAGPVRMGARFWAFVIDIVTLQLLFIGLELSVLSVFHFFRSEPHQIFQANLTLLFLTSPFILNWFAFKLGKQTPGQYAMQFRVVGVEGMTPHYGKRILHLVEVLVSTNEKDGIFSWDRKSNTRAISTQPKSPY